MRECWHVYILECADKTLYTGIALDAEKRLIEHNTINARAAKYVRARRPAKLVYQEKLFTRSKALKREHQIKSMPREMKLALVLGRTNKRR